MTAKIKLNAASGGGSISINAPSSAGSDTDFLDTSGNLAVSGTTTCTGNLKVGTITDTSGNNSSTTAQISQGRAKVWCSYNGSTNSIIDSFSISSVADNGTGDFTFNYSVTISNPCPLVMNSVRSNQTTSTSPAGVRSPSGHTDPADGITSTSVRIIHRPTSTHVDANFYAIAVFGD